MCVETGVGIACGCLPGCKPLMNRCFPRYFATTNNSSGSYPRRWQHNHAKQIDDEESIQPSGSMRSESVRLTSPRATDDSVVPKPTPLQRTTSGRTHTSIAPSLSRQSSAPSRTTSLTTTRTVNANSMRTPTLHRSPSHTSQNTFTTTITAQPHLSRSTSRHNTRWGSVDIHKPLPKRPAPSAIAARRPNPSGFRRSRQTSRELSTISNASTEMIILQGRDTGSGKQSSERKDDVWMG